MMRVPPTTLARTRFDRPESPHADLMPTLDQMIVVEAGLVLNGTDAVETAIIENTEFITVWERRILTGVLQDDNTSNDIGN